MGEILCDVCGTPFNHEGLCPECEIGELRATEDSLRARIAELIEAGDALKEELFEIVSDAYPMGAHEEFHGKIAAWEEAKSHE